jgi:hypothetical protein
MGLRRNRSRGAVKLPLASALRMAELARVDEQSAQKPQRMRSREDCCQERCQDALSA